MTLTLVARVFGVCALGIAFWLSTFSVDAKSDNTPPTAVPDVYTGHGTVSAPAPGVLSNDTDPDPGDHLTTTATLVNTPYGPAYVGWNGAAGFSSQGTGGNGTATIPYTVCDGHPGGCSSATVTFISENAPPMTYTDFFDVYDTSGGTEPGESILDNDRDPDPGDTFSTTAARYDLPGGATILIGWNGSAYYARNGSTVVGMVTAGYNVCDNLGLCNVGVVAFMVHPKDGAANAGETCSDVGKPVSAVGKPVNVTNGNMWLEQTDYALPGNGEILEVSRFYNSINQKSGLFGFGWTTKFDESLQFYGDKMIRLNTPNGRAAYFGRVNTSDDFVNASSGVQGRIAVNQDGSYTLFLKDGRSHHFSSTGVLLSLKDRNANQTTLYYDANSLLTSITDAFGRTLTLARFTDKLVISDSTGLVATYDFFAGSALLQSVTYPDDSKYEFLYDSTTAPGKILLKTVKDALGKVLETHAYDSQGRATTSEIEGGAEKYTLSYPSTSYTLVTDGRGKQTKYYIQPYGSRPVVKKIEGLCACSGGSEVAEYFYDSKLNLVKKIDALGTEYTYKYDLNSNLIELVDVFGTQKLTYNSFGQVLTYKDRVDSQSQNTNTAVLAYDSIGNLTSYTDALGKVTTIQYPATNNKGLPDWIRDARNNTTKFKWFAASGLLEETEDPYTKKTKFTYDPRGRVKTVTNALNHITTYNYFDDTQRKVELVYPNSDKITYKYDIRRKLESVTDERGKVTAYEFDPQYRLKKITDPLGHAKEFSYDIMSNMTSYKDPLANITDYKYDDFNRLEEIRYPAAESTAGRLTEQFEYDKIGRIKKYIDTADRLTEYGYNDTTRTNTVTNAESEVTTTKYNQRLQTFEVKDAANQVYTFSYDPLGRMLSQTRAGGTTSFEYNEIGDVKKRLDYLGRETKYTYDYLNRLTEIEYLPSTAFGTTFYTPNQKSTYGYDDISRLTSATNEMGTVTFGYDNRNRTTSTTDVFGHNIVYEYERTTGVNQKRLKFDGSMYATYNYDDAGRLSNILNASDNATITFGYDAEDKLTSRAYPNGVTTTYSYYDNDLLKRLKDSTTSATLFDRQYGYNSANQIQTLTELTNSRTFTYDLVDRLKTVTAASGPNESYNYDDVGNRTSSHRSATYGYQAGQFNRLTSTQTATYQFDANGNTVQKSEGSNFWRYVWDYENRLGEAATRKQTVRYKYDALGRRVQRFIVGAKENTKFINDGRDVLVDDNAGTLTKYLNADGIDNKLRQTTGSTTSYFLADHLGSTNGLADGNGALTASTGYDSFGNSTNASFPSRYQFTGRESDSFSGFNYYRARWYDANLGRFASEDPIGFGGGDVNLYSYVKNRPLLYTDPLGLLPYDDWKIYDAVYKWGENFFCQDLAPDFIQGSGAFYGMGANIALTRDGDVLIGYEADVVAIAQNGLKDPSSILTRDNKFGLSGSVSSQKILARGRLTREQRMDIASGSSYQASAGNGGYVIAGQMSPTREGNYLSLGLGVGGGISVGASNSEPYFRLPISWGAPSPQVRGGCGCGK